jgi:hypothetical protein
MPVATSIVMDVVSFIEPSRQPPCGCTKAHNDQLRAVFPTAAVVIGLAITGEPENDGQLSRWQEAVGHQIIPDTHKNGCVDEPTTGLMPVLFLMLFQDVVFG